MKVIIKPGGREKKPGRRCIPGGVAFPVLAAAVVMGCAGCGGWPGRLLPDESTEPVDTDGYTLLARFAHISDAHLTDEESPGRLTAAAAVSVDAWRPQEAYSTQLLDGFVRTVNKMHVALHSIDFVIHTGDAMDNAQLNELNWFVTVLDGGRIDPRSGPDDRDPSSLPDPLLDPHHPFDAQGLYRYGIHGDDSTIDWYSLLGNHDRFAVGVFPIVTDVLGRRTSPLPLTNRIPLTFPVALDPTGQLAWAPITPAHPGPPPEISLPVIIEPNPDRRFITDREFVDAHLTGDSQPPGHGFDPSHADRTWYSISPVPGLRVIGLNSSTPLIELPTLVYSEGAISLPQVQFLRQELEEAQRLGECVIVATHHPSDSLEPVNGTALTPVSFRQMLNAYPCVRLHIAGHWHMSATIDHGGYVEIVTGSTLDPPQQGRIIEVWRKIEPRASARAESPIEPHASARAELRVEPQASAPVDDEPEEGSFELRYWMFSHLDEIDPPDEAHTDLFDDPLMPMRRIAAELAGAR